MNHLLITVLILSLLSFTAIATAAENHTTDTSGVITEQSGGSGSATQEGGSSDSTKWHADINKTDGTCWSSDYEEQITNTRHDTADGTYTTHFSGVIESGTPCHNIGITDVEQDGNTYTLNITTERTNTACVDCVGQITYDTEFSANHPYRLNIRYNGEHIDTLNHPAHSESTEQSLLDRIFSWLSRLL